MKTRILRTQDDIKRCADNILKLGQYLPLKIMIDQYKPTRSIEQNEKMWAMLGEISAQVDWYGQKLSSEDWKAVFSSSLKGQRTVPGIDGGFVVFGVKTSKMTVPEMMDMIALMEAFGVEHGVIFKEDENERSMG